MRDIYRDINLPIDTNTLPDLEGLDKSDIVNAFRLVTSEHGITRSINRLHNDRKRRAGLVIKAHQLVNQGFEAMAEIEICLPDGQMILGRITNAVDIGNADTIAVTVLQKRHQGGEKTWLVGRDSELRVWKKEFEPGRPHLSHPVDYDKPMTHGFIRAGYIAEHLTTFFGKRMSVKNVGTGVLRRLEVRDAEPDVFHFDLGILRDVRVHENTLVQVHRTLEPTQYSQVRARVIKQSPNDFLGRRVVFDDDRVDGRLEQVTRMADSIMSVVFKVNGEQSRLSLDEMVKVYPRDTPGVIRPGRNPFWGGTLVSPRRHGRTMMQQAFLQWEDELLYPKSSTTQTQAYSLYNGSSKLQWRGMQARLKPGLEGTLTDVRIDDEGKVLLVIDGVIYKRNRNHLVTLWKKENN